METLLLACLSLLAVETTVRLWPRWYDCGTECPRRRLARYLIIYPALAAGIVLSRECLDTARLALLLVLAVIAALDLAYHHISLPFQAALIMLTVVIIGRSEEPAFHAIAGLVIGGIVVGVALLTGQQVSLEAACCLSLLRGFRASGQPQKLFLNISPGSLSEAPFIHEGARIVKSRIGSWTEIGRNTTIVERVKAYIGVPKEFEKTKLTDFPKARAKPGAKCMTVLEISKSLGANI